MLQFIVVARDCHRGLLGSLDALSEAFALLPCPEGMIVSIPSIQVQGRPGFIHGVKGKMDTRSGTIEIETDPRGASLTLVAKSINLRPEDEKRLFTFLYAYFGAKELSLS